MTHDRVTALGSGVDGAVRRISTTYELGGLPVKTRSYDNAAVGSGLVVNEVERIYNSFGQLVTEYQEHLGAVVALLTPKVQYAYADGSANHVRQTSLTYPNGTAVDKQYVTGGAIDDVLSRIAKLRYNATDLATMTYLGTGTVVELDDVPGELMRLA